MKFFASIIATFYSVFKSSFAIGMKGTKDKEALSRSKREASIIEEQFTIKCMQFVF